MHIELYDYQKQAVKTIRKLDGKAGLFMEMGTGKTRVSLASMVNDDGTLGAEFILVVCPSAVAGVWKGEVRKLGLPYKILDLTHGSIPHRAKRLAKLKRFDQPFIIIVNYEAYWREPLRRQIVTRRLDAAILDEIHRTKHRTAKQSRFAHVLGQREDLKFKLGLSGTPITAGLQDAFSIYKFINPDIFGERYADFERRYVKKGGFFNKKIVGYKNVKSARKKIAATSFQIAKSEALDLPEQVDIDISFSLNKKARKLYDQFTVNSIAEIEGLSESGEPITGTAVSNIMLTMMIRQQQLTGGFIKTEDDQIVDVDDDKIRVTSELIDDALASGQKVVVYCRFLHDIERWQKKYPDSDIFSGQNKRNRPFIQEGKWVSDKRIMFAQIRAASLGLDFTDASICIFYSANFSLDDFAQVRDRHHRIGQTNKVTYYYVSAKDTVDDEDIYPALRSKQSIASKLHDLDYARKILSRKSRGLLDMIEASP